MKKKYLKLIFIFLFLVSFSLSQAQTYKSAVGLTGGFMLGLTAKNFFSKSYASEFYAVSKFKGVILSEIITTNWKIFPDKRFSVLLGGGMHSGFYNGKSYQSEAGKSIFKPLNLNVSSRQIVFNLGADVVVGLEFNLNEYPFVFEIAFKPYYDLFAADSKTFDGFIALRYITKRYNPYNSHFKVKRRK